MLSISEMSKEIHKMQCTRYGVDSIEFDFLATDAREVDVTAMDEHWIIFGGISRIKNKFRCPVVRWTIKGKKFAAAIPVHLESKYQDDIISYYKSWHEDHPVMEEELLRMINESKSGDFISY